MVACVLVSLQYVLKALGVQSIETGVKDCVTQSAVTHHVHLTFTLTILRDADKITDLMKPRRS